MKEIHIFLGSVLITFGSVKQRNKENVPNPYYRTLEVLVSM